MLASEFAFIVYAITYLYNMALALPYVALPSSSHLPYPTIPKSRTVVSYSVLLTREHHLLRTSSV